MNLIEKIGTATVSCGACKNNELCGKCRVLTMRANGLPEEWADELKGLQTTYNNSQVYRKLQELQKRTKIRS